MRKLIGMGLSVALLAWAANGILEEFEQPSMNIPSEISQHVFDTISEAENLRWSFKNNQWDQDWVAEKLPEVKQKCDRVIFFADQYSVVIQEMDKIHGHGLKNRIAIATDFCQRYIVRKSTK